ncbi:hypothetical protein [Kitasatospora aureofaciens]|uniref:hypothetical protein n=1 Tax=Kitasatospora aureofaciens TaxID=1894 RepID=UPI00210E4DCE|nr:hypothetical protein [Kitasatospora aureofaciens]
MIVLAVVPLAVGFVATIAIRWAIWIILAVIGLVLVLLVSIGAVVHGLLFLLAIGVLLLIADVVFLAVRSARRRPGPRPLRRR